MSIRTLVNTVKAPITMAVAALMLAGCADAWQNTQPARQLARQAEPAGSVYTGWRVFQQKCAACHGPAASGTSVGPDLLPRVRGMGPRRFVGIVLQRYDWGMPDVRASADIATREVLIDEVLRREDTALTMPAWEGEPIVNAHIADLYAYLSARAEGTQGSGRPGPSRP
ncbi:cytochrome c [Ideonella sp.]|uniref:c-type cytochrome n=1 Tax=Ideonella sp. TaxID=1929293 RepID=UPI0035AE989F